MTKHKTIYLTIAATALSFMILDSRAVIEEAGEAVSVCVKTVIPSLFPFFFLSILLTGNMTGTRISLLEPLGRLCGIPRGGESLLVMGLLGGYPVGAQCIHQAWHTKRLGTEDARHMLTFCSNAGPAFIFGIAGSMFGSPSAPWILWGIHIASALITGVVFRNRNTVTCVPEIHENITVQAAMDKAIRAMASVCGWVITFRVLYCFFARWFLWAIPVNIQAVISGILELTGGCLQLRSIADESTRFVLCAFFLGFGGLCVVMQTASAVRELGMKWYLKGKILQSILSIQFALVAQSFLFPFGKDPKTIILMLGMLVLTICIIIFIKIKKYSRFSSKAIV